MIMKRFILFMQSELSLVRTSLPAHLVGILQPMLMFWLMSLVFVNPTFDMVVDTSDPHLAQLAAAMAEVGTPSGVHYINVLDWQAGPEEVESQAVFYEENEGKPTALQVFGPIDSNLVKNYRNRLTSAALRLWNKELAGQAVNLVEYPWLPGELPFILFFGIAMLPMAAVISSSLSGAMLMAQDFEGSTILEYRLSPVSSLTIILVRLLRLVIVGLLSTGCLLGMLYLVSGVWPQQVWRIFLALLPIIIIGACVGLSAGLLTRRTLPAFVISLVFTLATWILGSSFGLSSGFGGWYETLSRFIPNTYAVELIFPSYYFGVSISSAWINYLFLGVVTLAFLALLVRLYRSRLKAGF